MEIVNIDKSGRIVIPNTLREKLGLENGSKLVLAEIKDDTLILKKLDVDELARKIEEELRDVDVDAIVTRVKADIREKIKKKHPEIFG
ncbi:MAG: AbrB/MazE/SpoVT family DNA-binding domain-containing protein [Candidatus Hydrothermarchaeota archaeon]